MKESKKSSAWVEFEKRQKQEYRESHPRSWGWVKAVGVVVVGIALGGLAVLLFGPSHR